MASLSDKMVTKASARSRLSAIASTATFEFARKGCAVDHSLRLKLDQPRRFDRNRRPAMAMPGAGIMDSRLTGGIFDHEMRALRVAVPQLHKRRRIGDADIARGIAVALAQAPLPLFERRKRGQRLATGLRRRGCFVIAGSGNRRVDRHREQSDDRRQRYRRRTDPAPGRLCQGASRQGAVMIHHSRNIVCAATTYNSSDASSVSETGKPRAQKAQSTVIKPESSAIASRSSTGNFART